MTNEEIQALADLCIGTYGLDEARAMAFCICARAAEDDGKDALEAKAMEEQAAMIEALYGKDCAETANYGWGCAGGDERVSIATKLYGAGAGAILQSEVDYETGTIEHEWQ